MSDDVTETGATETAAAGATDTGTAAVEPKRPWGEGEYDEARAARLIENLRAEVAGLKKAAKTAEKPSDPDEALRNEVAELREKLSTATKRELLTKRGLPENLIGALNGDDEDAWKQMADMLAELKSPKNSGTRRAADPVQSARDAGTTKEQADLALARQIFGD